MNQKIPWRFDVVPLTQRGHLHRVVVSGRQRRRTLHHGSLEAQTDIEPLHVARSRYIRVQE